MKGLKLFAPLFLVLAACSGGPQTLNVSLVDGLGEPLQPLAAAWRIGPSSGNPWVALPAGQSNWSLPIPSGARFQVAFRCPDVGTTQFYVSLDLRRSELGSNLVVRCPSAYASPTALVDGGVNPSLSSGSAFSARGTVAVANSIFGTSYSSLVAPTGTGREVAVFGVSSGNHYFGRTGLVNIPPGGGTFHVFPIVAGTLNVVTPHITSYAGLVLRSSVPVDLANLLGPGSHSVARPTNLGPGDLFQFWTCHSSCCGIHRRDAMDPAVASGSNFPLPVVPNLFLTVNETHNPTSLPTFTFSTTGSSSASLSALGYALFLAEPGVRYWRHFVSPGALGSAANYYVDVESASGFSGILPNSGASVQLNATIFFGDKPLSTLFAARPIPEETHAAYTLFLDRMLPVRLEAFFYQTSFTW